ncbi:MAG TPA: glycosyltransferase family 2 protein, partial [Bacteroidota bacterium]|nr:glycosyltransferase family 2 protein [Bacteroidota bacterium]
VVLRHSTNRGKGAALRTGIEHVLGNEGFDSAITMDADMQHDPNDLPAFIEAWSAQKADILLGCRQRFGRGMPLHRILSNTITSALVSAKTGVKIPDSQTGYRMIGRRVLESVQFVSDGYEAETEFLLKAARRGCRISSVPIATIYTGATSHMTHWRTTWRFLQVLLREYE